MTNTTFTLRYSHGSYNMVYFTVVGDDAVNVLTDGRRMRVTKQRASDIYREYLRAGFYPA